MAFQMPNNTALPPGEPEPSLRQGDKLYVSELSATAANAKHHFAGEVTGISGDLLQLDGAELAITDGGPYRLVDTR